MSPWCLAKHFREWLWDGWKKECPALHGPPSVTENCHCHCHGRHEIGGHENNKPARVCLECSTLCSNRHDFDSNNISKQFLNLADRKNTNHLDKCVSSTFWRGAMRVYPVSWASMRGVLAHSAILIEFHIILLGCWYRHYAKLLNYVNSILSAHIIINITEPNTNHWEHTTELKIKKCDLAQRNSKLET